MRISDWSSDVCSSDLIAAAVAAAKAADVAPPAFEYQLFAAAKRPATGAAGRHCLHPRVFRTVPPGRHPARKRGTCCRALKQLKQRSRRGRVGAIAAAETLAGINLFVGLAAAYSAAARSRSDRKDAVAGKSGAVRE